MASLGRFSAIPHFITILLFFTYLPTTQTTRPAKDAYDITCPDTTDGIPFDCTTLLTEPPGTSVMCERVESVIFRIHQRMQYRKRGGKDKKEIQNYDGM
jgi:hypothetical protein